MKIYQPFFAVVVNVAKRNINMKVEVGQKAPEFSLFDSEKTKVSLSDYKGKNVVILFFPQAFTSVCTTELCNVRDNISQYNNTNAQVFGISVDSIFTLARFKDDQKLNFPLLSDFNKEASAAYYSLINDFVFDMKGVSKRAAFVIDKEGVVQYAEVLDKVTDLPDFDAIQQTLQRLN
ncbi:redoxin domain-containing protein [Flavihumibacter profundi]|uniref:redoxin domain-containing protein n=1 Tax=Flavihumibacter profundi TaxID=2716883 RepID=UPI001CC6D540|nr:redoxin domain-containing protein [Flavihumibacter profundi]MBZ5859253.1 redoxin domain-containing protein [Flavihumibacter profundi]